MSTRGHVERNLKALATPNDPELLREIAEIVAPVKDAVWSSGREENWG
jgi:hypothetical protein